MKVSYYTKLDAATSHVERLNHDPINGAARVPSIGEIIRFYPKGFSNKFFELEVLQIATNVAYHNPNLYPSYEIEIELGVPKNNRFKGLVDTTWWSDWLVNHLK